MYTHSTARQVADASGAVKDSPLYNAIGGTVSELAAAESTIRGRAADIRSVLDRVEGKLTQCGVGQARLNDLGELQRSGQDYDNAIAKLASLERQLGVLLSLADEA